MLEAGTTCETLVNLYQTTRRNNPEDCHLHTRRRANLKSHSPRLSVIGNSKAVNMLTDCKMGGTCSTHRRNENWSENLKGRDHVEELGVNGSFFF
jgi:hypothetical protein